MKKKLLRQILFSVAVLASAHAFAVVNDITLRNIAPKAGDLDIQMRSLEVVMLNFSTDVNVRENTLAYLTTPDGQELTSVMERNQYMKNTVLLNFPDITYYNGDYTLTIKRWSVGDDEWLADYEQGHSNAEIKVVWTVSNGLTAGVDYDLQPVSVLPANNTSFTYPAQPLVAVQVTMPSGAVKNPEIEATLSCVEARYNSTLTFVAEDRGKNIVYTATVSPPPSYKGDYMLSIPAGMFGDEQYISEGTGHASPDITMMYSVTPSDEGSTGDEEYVDWTLQPSTAKLVANENDYTMNWSWSGGTQINTELLSEWKILDSRRYKVPGITFTLLDAADPKAGVKFTAELNKEETYTLLVPQGMFHDATYASSDGKLGMANPQLRYDFVPEDITSGVTAAVADEKPANRSVYTSQGIRLYDNATEEQIRNLPAGLYIIAGKKVMKR